MPSGGGSVILKKDHCPAGDFSPSYYDDDCGTAPSDINNEHTAANENEQPLENV
jgi:hypothetical protein